MAMQLVSGATAKEETSVYTYRKDGWAHNFISPSTYLIELSEGTHHISLLLFRDFDHKRVSWAYL